MNTFTRQPFFRLSYVFVGVISAIIIISVAVDSYFYKESIMKKSVAKKEKKIEKMIVKIKPKEEITKKVEEKLPEKPKEKIAKIEKKGEEEKIQPYLFYNRY